MTKSPITQLADRFSAPGARLRPTTIRAALGELETAGVVVAAASQDGVALWAAVRAAEVRRFDHLDLHGPHDLRHTFATWLEDAGIPGRVIDELMGHDNTHRARQDRVSRIGMGYRDTTPEMLGRVVAAIESRLAVVLEVAECEASLCRVPASRENFLYELQAGPWGRRHDRHGRAGRTLPTLGMGSNRTASLGDARIRPSQTLAYEAHPFGVVLPTLGGDHLG
jgi:hypothetical protein